MLRQDISFNFSSKTIEWLEWEKDATVGHQLMLDINESNQYAKIFYTCSLDFSEMVGSIVQPHVFQDAVNLSMFAALM